ncbi:nucleotidyltransferase domain-containing protein [Persephonella sp.]|uniref:nucleotidyltransferase family protein n=1 Tax=Persephonella sp. TaxID=2060922 RepID=UPI00260AA5DB|nr:nucleotidyltransferase domain-containing protein [Persephonella sp.]
MFKAQKVKTIEDLKEFLQQFFKGENVKVYLFGSRAEGRNTQYSDIDLAFDLDKDISGKLSQLRYILEESNLPYKVDIVDLKSAPYLKQVIKEKGKRWL